MILFQEATQEVAEEVLSEEKTLSVIDLIVNGGTASVIIIAILFVLLFVALYIYFERVFAIKAASKIDKNFMLQIRDHVSNGKLEVSNTSETLISFISGVFFKGFFEEIFVITNW